MLRAFISCRACSPGSKTGPVNKVGNIKRFLAIVYFWLLPSGTRSHNKKDGQNNGGSM
jgi:hypothetical protein